MLALIRKQLLKLDSIKRVVTDYKRRQQKQKDNLLFAKLMHSGYTVRELEPKKMQPWDTLGIVTDDGLLEEWQGGKVVARGVTQGFIDSTQWGGEKCYNSTPK